MTREEAIEIITLMHEMARNSVSTNTSNAEALDMAIRALKCEPTDEDLVKENTDLVKEDAENADKKGISGETVSQRLVKDGDLISRTELLNKIWQKEYGKDYDGVNTLNIPHIDIIENIPSAEKTAEWIDLGFEDEWFGAVGKCSNCGNENLIGFKYCLNCGARMGVE